MNRLSLTIPVVLVFLLCQEFPSFADAELPVYYRPGTEFLLIARMWGLSATGTMKILESSELNGKNLIFIRSQVTELGGLLGFIVKFLRVYRESNTFDSYIDPDTRMTEQYEVYKLKDDGSKKITERIWFDRERNRIVSLESNKTIMRNASPNIQDAFSIFLDLLYRFNTEELFAGKRFHAKLYAHKKVAGIIVELSHISLLDGKEVHTFEIEKLPTIFIYPASISFEVTDVDGLMLVTEGSCTIHIPAFPDITVNAELKEVKRAS